MRLLITGARGFLGSTIGRVAAEQGWEIHGLGRVAQPPSSWVGGYSQCDVSNADLRDVMNYLSPHIVFHGAGTASVAQSFASPLDDFRASVFTFTYLLDAVHRSNTNPLVIFPSSAAVYGQPQTLPVAESHACNPISPYGVHKLQAELMAESYCRHFGLNVVSCRIFSVFGPTQRRLLVWELFQQVFENKKTLVLKGTGSETRAFLYADDLATSILALGQLFFKDPPGFQVFNAASGDEVSVMTIVDIIQELLGESKPVNATQRTPSGDPERWIAKYHKTKEQYSRLPFIFVS